MPHNDTVVHLLLFTNRPIVLACFSQLERLGSPLLQVSGRPLTTERDGELPQYIAGASIAAIDVAPDPARAIRVCQELHCQAPDLPLLGIVCCKGQIHLLHLQALVTAGVNSLIDLSLTPEALLHALLRIASGSTVIQIDFPWPDSPGGLLVKLFGSPHPRRNTLMFGFFTERETTQMLEGIVCGFSDQEMGKRLCLSLSAVHHRVERLCKATGTRNRTELAAWAGMWGFYASSVRHSPG